MVDLKVHFEYSLFLVLGTCGFAFFKFWFWPGSWLFLKLYNGFCQIQINLVNLTWQESWTAKPKFRNCKTVTASSFFLTAPPPPPPSALCVTFLVVISWVERRLKQEMMFVGEEEDEGEIGPTEAHLEALKARPYQVSPWVDDESALEAVWSPDLPSALFFGVCSRSFFTLISAFRSLKWALFLGMRALFALFLALFEIARYFYGNFLNESQYLPVLEKASSAQDSFLLSGSPRSGDHWCSEDHGEPQTWFVLERVGFFTAGLF